MGTTEIASSSCLPASVITRRSVVAGLGFPMDVPTAASQGSWQARIIAPGVPNSTAVPNMENLSKRPSLAQDHPWLLNRIPNEARTGEAQKQEASAIPAITHVSATPEPQQPAFVPGQAVRRTSLLAGTGVPIDVRIENRMY